MGLNERTAMPAGHTPAPPPPPPTITKPGESGATVDKNARDEAVVKLANSLGVLCQEAAESLRQERDNPEYTDVSRYQLIRWRHTLRKVLLKELQKAGLTWAQVRDGLAETWERQLPDWWWELKEGVFDEMESYYDANDLDAGANADDIALYVQGYINQGGDMERLPTIIRESFGRG